MRVFKDIKNDIFNRISNITGKSIRETSSIGIITSAVAEEMSTAYKEIENAKDPHIYTNLDTDGLNATGVFVNVPREDDETDSNYLYRIMNWTYMKESSNETAINDSLLNLKYSSNAQFINNTRGAGTGTVYVIPLSYDEETIANALEEAKIAIKQSSSPLSYIDFIIPTIKTVELMINIQTTIGDINLLKTTASDLIKEYVNTIAPSEYLKLGDVNRIGQQMNAVDYFVVTGLYINGVATTSTKVMQDIDTKLLFNGIMWEDEEE